MRSESILLYSCLPEARLSIRGLTAFMPEDIMNNERIGEYRIGGHSII
jgi:hypothetical protein